MVQALHLAVDSTAFPLMKRQRGRTAGCVLVRVRLAVSTAADLGTHRLASSADTPRSSIRYIERVLSPMCWFPHRCVRYRSDCHWAHTANILHGLCHRAWWRPNSGWPRRSADRSAAHCQIMRKAVLPGVGTNRWDHACWLYLCRCQYRFGGAAQGYRRLTANYARQWTVT